MRKIIKSWIKKIYWNLTPHINPNNSSRYTWYNSYHKTPKSKLICHCLNVINPKLSRIWLKWRFTDKLGGEECILEHGFICKVWSTHQYLSFDTILNTLLWSWFFHIATSQVLALHFNIFLSLIGWQVVY